MKIRVVSIAGLLATGLLVCAGCGGSDETKVALAPAKGKVIFNGGPLPDVAVTFIPEKGPVAIGKTDLEGKFTLKTGTTDGATIGPGTFTLTPPQAAGTNAAAAAGQMTEPPKNAEEQAKAAQKMIEMMQNASKAPAAKTETMFPAKYLKLDTSTLKQNVQSDGSKNDFTLDVSS